VIVPISWHLAVPCVDVHVWRWAGNCRQSPVRCSAQPCVVPWFSMRRSTVSAACAGQPPPLSLPDHDECTPPDTDRHAEWVTDRPLCRLHADAAQLGVERWHAVSVVTASPPAIGPTLAGRATSCSARLVVRRWYWFSVFALAVCHWHVAGWSVVSIKSALSQHRSCSCCCVASALHQCHCLAAVYIHCRQHLPCVSVSDAAWQMPRSSLFHPTNLTAFYVHCSKDLGVFKLLLRRLVCPLFGRKLNTLEWCTG